MFPFLFPFLKNEVFKDRSPGLGKRTPLGLGKNGKTGFLQNEVFKAKHEKGKRENFSKTVPNTLT